jgi:hypothetical protein
MIPSAEITTLDRGDETRRDAILSALEQWKSGAERGVAHLFYYFGHGGRARFADIPEGGERVVHFLSCSPENGGKDRLLFLRELANHLGDLHDRCENVSVILDSCYSGAFRSGAEIWHYDQTPAWARPALHTPMDPHLAAEGHPMVVRLCGASPRREAIAADLKVRGELIEGIGLLTNLLLRELEEAGDCWWRMSWETLAHAIRQRVISKVGNESQWVALGGPAERLLFSTDRAKRVWAVGTAVVAGHHWIRAGRLTGAEVGDEWGLVGRYVNDTLEHQPIVRTVIDLAESNIARLGSLDLPEEGPSPVAATLTRVGRRMPVFVDGAANVLAELAWIEAGDRESRHWLQLGTDEIRVIDRTGDWGITCFMGDDRLSQAVELLEDRARVARLSEVVDSLPPSPKPSRIEWTVGVETDTISSGAEVAPGSAVWVHLRNPNEEGGNWFVSVVLIDAIGRPMLINASQVDGVELDQRDEEYIGRRTGAARRGLVLDWPDGIVERGSGRLRLLLLASKRPIQLGHLTRALPNSEIEALRMQGLERRRTAARPAGSNYRTTQLPGPQMAHSEGWAAKTFELVLSGANPNVRGDQP